MAILFLEGFDHYDTSAHTATLPAVIDPDRYSSRTTGTTNYGGIQTMPSAGGLCAGVHVDFNATDDNYHACLKCKLPAGNIVSGADLGIGFHFYMTALPSDTGCGIIGFGSTGTSDSFWTLSINSSGQLNIVLNKPNGTSVANSGSNVMSATTVYHIEMQVHWHASAGSVEVRVNGAQWIVYTGHNTMPSSTASVLYYLPVTGGGGPTGLWYFDDVFIYDKTGTVNNDWFGERNIYTILPDADTVTADWTLSSGSDGYALVGQVPDDDDDLLTATSVDDESVFDLDALASTSIAILAVQVVARADKTGTDPTNLAMGLNSNYGSDHSLTQSVLNQYVEIFEQNPDTSDFWTPGQINNVKLGIKKTL